MKCKNIIRVVKRLNIIKILKIEYNSFEYLSEEKKNFKYLRLFMLCVKLILRT